MVAAADVVMSSVAAATSAAAAAAAAAAALALDRLCLIISGRAVADDAPLRFEPADPTRVLFRAADADGDAGVVGLDWDLVGKVVVLVGEFDLFILAFADAIAVTTFALDEEAADTRVVLLAPVPVPVLLALVLVLEPPPEPRRELKLFRAVADPDDPILEEALLRAVVPLLLPPRTSEATPPRPSPPPSDSRRVDDAAPPLTAVLLLPVATAPPAAGVSPLLLLLDMLGVSEDGVAAATGFPCNAFHCLLPIRISSNSITSSVTAFRNRTKSGCDINSVSTPCTESILSPSITRPSSSAALPGRICATNKAPRDVSAPPAILRPRDPPALSIAMVSTTPEVEPAPYARSIDM